MQFRITSSTALAPVLLSLGLACAPATTSVAPPAVVQSPAAPKPPAAKPPSEPKPVAAKAPLTQSLDELLQVADLTDSGAKVSFRRITMKPRLLARSRTRPMFCTDADDEAAMSIFSESQGGLRKMSTLAPGFGEHTIPEGKKPCRTKRGRVFTRTGEFSIVDEKFDANGARTFERQKRSLKPPAGTESAQYTQSMPLGGNRHLVYWTKATLLVAAAVFNSETEDLVEIDVKLFGRSYGTARHGRFYLVSQYVNNACRGIYVFDDTQFVCAPSERRDNYFAIFRGQRRGLLGESLREPQAWQNDAGFGWMLRQVLPAGTAAMRSQLVGPDGSHYELLPDTAVTCHSPKTVGTLTKRYIAMSCTLQTPKTQTQIWWDVDDKVSVLPRRDEVEVKVRHEDVHGQAVSFFASGNYYRRWITQGTDDVVRLWRLGDRPFWSPQGSVSGPEAISRRPNVGPFRFALIQGSSPELVDADLGKATYKVLRRYRRRDCPGQITLGFTPLARAPYVVLHCVSGQTNAGTHHWSEVLDTEKKQRFRTPFYVRVVGADGTLVLTDTTKHGKSDDAHTGVFWARMP